MTDDLAMLIERNARTLAARLLVQPEWSECVDGLYAVVMDSIQKQGMPHSDAKRACGDIADRAAAILQEIATDPMAVVVPYRDLVPPDLRAKMTTAAAEWLRGEGITVETFKDDDGTTFLRPANVGALYAAELTRIANGAPGPVGALHRLQ